MPQYSHIQIQETSPGSSVEVMQCPDKQCPKYKYMLGGKKTVSFPSVEIKGAYSKFSTNRGITDNAIT